jgi:2-methylcitrate dehydratase PrpD
MSTVSNQLANFVHDFDFDNLSSKVIHQAKRCILDTVGVIIAGYNTPTGEIMSNISKKWGDKREATLIGDGSKVLSFHAALVNGTLGHVHELDDGHRFALGHPGVTAIPSALAVGEKIGSKGRDLIASTVLGYEGFIRIAKSINPSHRSRGFHTTGTCGTFASAIAASKLLKLDEEQITHALGIAGLQAAGLMEVMTGSSTVKPFNAGRASSNGVLSALLAESGLTAPENIFEGNNGFCTAYSDEYNIDKITQGLGEYYEINNTYIKLHASCRHSHPAIDCTLEIIDEEGLEPEEIESVIVDSYEAAYRLTGTNYEPKTVSTAKFSIPYCIAVALIYGKVSPTEFTYDKINNQKILKLAKKVTVNIDEEIDKLTPDKRGASVKILSKSEKKYKYMIENPRGEPELYVDDKELENKFKELAKPVIGKKVDELISAINKLEQIYDIREITNLFSN